MEGPLPTACLSEYGYACFFNKKNSPLSHMGQELHSCDTTQIDVKNVRSLHAPSRVPDG
jgi:hypothetical protein